MALPQQYIKKEFYTEDEYFEFSRTVEERWEFTPVGLPQSDGSRLGVIRAMSGGTPDHSAIAASIVRTLGNALVPKGCRVDTFPDVSVVCGGFTLYSLRKSYPNPSVATISVASSPTISPYRH